MAMNVVPLRLDCRPLALPRQILVAAIVACLAVTLMPCAGAAPEGAPKTAARKKSADKDTVVLVTGVVHDHEGKLFAGAGVYATTAERDAATGKYNATIKASIGADGKIKLGLPDSNTTTDQNGRFRLRINTDDLPGPEKAFAIGISSNRMAGLGGGLAGIAGVYRLETRVREFDIGTIKFKVVRE